MTNNCVHIAAKAVGKPGLIILRLPRVEVVSVIPKMEWARDLAREHDRLWDDTVLRSTTTLVEECARVANTLDHAQAVDLECEPLMLIIHGLTWLIHRSGRMEEFLRKPKTATAVVQIVPGAGMSGVSVGFMPLVELIGSAANDNSL